MILEAKQTPVSAKTRAFVDDAWVALDTRLRGIPSMCVEISGQCRDQWTWGVQSNECEMVQGSGAKCVENITVGFILIRGCRNIPTDDCVKL